MWCLHWRMVSLHKTCCTCMGDISTTRLSSLFFFESVQRNPLHFATDLSGSELLASARQHQGWCVCLASFPQWHLSYFECVGLFACLFETDLLLLQKLAKIQSTVVAGIHPLLMIHLSWQYGAGWDPDARWLLRRWDLGAEDACHRPPQGCVS